MRFISLYIHSNLDTGGIREIHNQFTREIGWRKMPDEIWSLTDNEAIYNHNKAPVGHLPARVHPPLSSSEQS